jgi:PAS domain S-box-containing protein
MKKRSFLAGATLFALGAGTRPAAAQALRLRYGGDAAFAPFESLDANGRAQGFQIDLLALLGPLIGAEFETRLRPWAETEQAFREGQVDVVGMVDTNERRAWALFTRGHATPALTVYRLQGQPDRQSLADLSGLRIALPDHDAMRETRRVWLGGLSGPFLPVADADQAMAALRNGDADVALLPRAYADPLLANGAAPGVLASHLNLNLQTYALAVAPARTDLQQRLQKGLDALEADGRLEQLRIRWLSSHRDLATRKQLASGLEAQRGRTWAVAAAGGGAALLLGAGLWWRGRHTAAERAARMVAEAALQQAETLLQHSFAQHPDPMVLVERSGSLVRDANAAMLAMLGLQPDQLIGQTLQALGGLVDAGALQQLVQSLADQGRLDAVPLRLLRADGSPRETLVSADVLPIDGTDHVFCLVRDITEQLAQDAALRQGYDTLAAQLQLAHQERDKALARQALAEARLHEFTRVVSHDLKTPLNAVLGYAGLLSQRLRDGHVQEAVQHAERIAGAASRMATMVDALGRLVQVDRQPLVRQPLDMAKLATDTWDLLQPQWAERQVQFRVDELPAAQGDPGLVAQVWQNLLGNAAKYSAGVAAPRVAVSSFQDERGTWYRVVDNGAGFDMDRARHLFVPFQRLHQGSQFEGSGVGLSLVRRIVDHHGGDVRLRSRPGVGTVAESTLHPEAGVAKDLSVSPEPA